MVGFNHVELISTGGNITAALPKGLGLDLDLKGKRVKVKDYSNINGRIDRNIIDASMHGGGIPVEMVSYGGKIQVNFKDAE